MLQRLRQLLFPSPSSSALRKRMLDRYGDMVEIPQSVRLEDFALDIRFPTTGKKRFIVGEGAVVSGKFVLEDRHSEIRIGKDTFIGGGLFIAFKKIEIGSDVMISWGCTVSDNDAHALASDERKEDVKNWKKDLEAGSPGRSKDWTKVGCQPVIIGDKSWIGFGSILLKGAQLDKGCVVGAGSVVTNSFESFSVIAGNPARFIKKTK